MKLKSVKFGQPVQWEKEGVLMSMNIDVIKGLSLVYEKGFVVAKKGEFEIIIPLTNVNSMVQCREKATNND